MHLRRTGRRRGIACSKGFAWRKPWALNRCAATWAAAPTESGSPASKRTSRTRFRFSRKIRAGTVPAVRSLGERKPDNKIRGLKGHDRRNRGVRIHASRVRNRSGIRGGTNLAGRIQGLKVRANRRSHGGRIPGSPVPTGRIRDGRSRSARILACRLFVRRRPNCPRPSGR